MSGAEPQPAAPIGLLVKTYPKLSETFILEEILGLERQGLPLRVFSLYPPADAITHASQERVRAPVSYLPPPRAAAALSLAASHAALLLRAPARYLAALRFCLRLREANRLRAFAQAGWLARRLTRLGIAHLHVHFASEPADVAELASLLSGISYSVSAHAKDVYLSRRASLRRKLRRARFVVTCTEYNRARLARIAGSGTAVLRMYHGVDLARFQRAAAPPDAAPPLLLGVGRLREKKGFAVLVEACRLLRDAGVQLRCEIVGYGEERGRLESLIARHALTGSVRLAGKMTHEELVRLYARATVFALPCRIAADGDRDGIPNVLLEALAMELAVVTTPVSGIPEVIEDGVNGLLVEPGDAPALAQAIRRLLDDAVLRETLGVAGRRTVAERFSNDVNLHTVSELLLAASHGGAHAATPALAARVAYGG